MEKNGLRHNDFDIKTPLSGYTWQVTSVDWDFSSTLLAVSLLSTVTSPDQVQHGCVQIYYRENYHWYLKQQFIGDKLRFLCFDEEIPLKLYLIESPRAASSSTAMRIVDMYWKIASSATRDGSVVVVDGDHLHFTPLGYNNVPPPMSMYQLPLSSWSSQSSALALQRQCARGLSFSSFLPGGKGWLLAVLVTSAIQSSILFATGDERGKVTKTRTIILDGVNEFTLRDVCIMIHDNDQQLSVFLSATSTVNLLLDDHSKSPHLLLYLQISLPDVVVVSDEALVLKPMIVRDVPDNIIAMSPIHNRHDDQEPACMTLGIYNFKTYSYDLLSLSTRSLRQSGSENMSFDALNTELLVSIPEVCPTLTVIAKSQKDTEEAVSQEASYSHTIIALSSRNRLYCGEVMLVANASSYSFNHAYNMLMVITAGTKPYLHFVSLATLARVHPLLMTDDSQPPLFESAEPRPVERGARIILTIEEDSKVVIQLPRGNLETFEPRALILLRAQKQLMQNNFFDCLLLLRLQRIDLNYLVDFNPVLFFACLTSFVSMSIAKKADLLSLFLTSLEAVDVTMTKYTLFDPSAFTQRQQRREFVINEKFEGAMKVNRVCMAMREELLAVLSASSSTQTQQQQQQHVVNAVLCSFAKQQPPLILDALLFIKQYQQAQQQQAIRYLSFLLQAEQLFNEAVAVCEFDLARAIARQSQMDPRAYLPLLERFESIGKGHDKQSLTGQRMQLEVYLHLERWLLVVDVFINMLLLFVVDASEHNAQDVLEWMQGYATQVQDIIRRENLFAHTLTFIATLEDNIGNYFQQSGNAKVDIVKRFITAIRSQYAHQAPPDLAIAAYLACYPPMSNKAVDIAMNKDDWFLAITLSSRYGESAAVVKLVNEIVSSFRQNQEMATFSSSSGMMQQQGDGQAQGESRAIQAARLAVDYLNDVEAAVSILSTAQHWQAAVAIAMKHQRTDLLEEIFTASRQAAVDLIAMLQQQKNRLPVLFTLLKELWTDPEKRIEAAAANDVSLQRALKAEMIEEDYQQQKEMLASDTASEFSSATRHSLFSLQSGGSALSVLSARSSTSTTVGASSVAGSSSAFSIEGIDHALLSRGRAMDPSQVPLSTGSNNKKNRGEKKQAMLDRQQIRKQRSEERQRQTEPREKDPLGLKKEAAACDELYSIVASLPTVTATVQELCTALAMAEDRTLQRQVKVALQALREQLFSVQLVGEGDGAAKATLAQNLLRAPLYPMAWLQHKDMLSVVPFQDTQQLVNERLKQRVEQGRDAVITTADMQELRQADRQRLFSDVVRKAFESV